MLRRMSGGFAGALIGIALSFALLAGQGVNGFVWLAAFLFFCFVCIPLGAGAAFGLWRIYRDRDAARRGRR